MYAWLNETTTVSMPPRVVAARALRDVGQPDATVFDGEGVDIDEPLAQVGFERGEFGVGSDIGFVVTTVVAVSIAVVVTAVCMRVAVRLVVVCPIACLCGRSLVSDVAAEPPAPVSPGWPFCVPPRLLQPALVTAASARVQGPTPTPSLAGVPHGSGPPPRCEQRCTDECKQRDDGGDPGPDAAVVLTPRSQCHPPP